MKNIIEILMQRDKMTEKEVMDLIADVKEEMMIDISRGDFEGAYETFSSWTGLEPDYIMDIF